MTVPVIGFFLQIPRMVKVVEESSPYFKVISPKDISHKTKMIINISLYFF